MEIIITDCDHDNIDEEKKVLDGAGIKYKLLQCQTEDDVIKNCKGTEILMNQYAPMSSRVLEALSPELKQVVRYGVGTDNVDLDKATELGIQICNVPDYGMNEVADQAMALLLALARKVVIMNDYTKNHKWDYSRAIPIYRIIGQTAGIVGLGRIGKCFAKRINGFGCKIIAWDPRYKCGEIVKVDNVEVEIVEFKELLKKSDLISIHCPLNEKTRHIFNDEAFDLMKETAYVVNTARGGIVDEEALYRALKEDKIAGAGIDVYEDEPVATNYKLYEFENMLSTPHIAWYSEQAASELKRKVAEEASRFALGEELHYPVNKLK